MLADLSLAGNSQTPCRPVSRHTGRERRNMSSLPIRLGITLILGTIGIAGLVAFADYIII